MRRHPRTGLVARGLLLLASGILLRLAAAQTPLPLHASAPDYGVRFVCAPSRLEQAETTMARYLRQLGIAPSQVQKFVDPAHGTLSYALLGSPPEATTLFLAWRPELAIQDDTVLIPLKNHTARHTTTVSKKEILLALLHPGRLTVFKGTACGVDALIDHVAVRQNIVMWAQTLEWGWPDGGAAQWNTRYWRNGTPQPQVALHDALNDLFFQQSKYSIGCYTATKMVFAQGVLDYYRRVKKDPVTANLVAQRLLADREPLVGLEPARMWSFESDFEPAERRRPGKILRMVDHVSANSFVPGDWIYFLNTDPSTYQKTGYEGSNAIYLGRNRFDDYYNDNLHHYSYKEKLGEVYQWRNGVFSRRRDYAKMQPLSAQDYARLSATPERGGLLMGFRVAPYLFGFEPLPDLPGLTQTPRAPAPGSHEKPGSRAHSGVSAAR